MGQYSRRNKAPTLLFSRNENSLTIASDKDERVVSIEPPFPFPMPENSNAPSVSLELSLRLPSINVGDELSVSAVPLPLQGEE